MDFTLPRRYEEHYIAIYLLYDDMLEWTVNLPNNKILLINAIYFFMYKDRLVYFCTGTVNCIKSQFISIIVTY